MPLNYYINIQCHILLTERINLLQRLRQATNIIGIPPDNMADGEVVIECTLVQQIQSSLCKGYFTVFQSANCDWAALKKSLITCSRRSDTVAPRLPPHLKPYSAASASHIQRQRPAANDLQRHATRAPNPRPRPSTEPT